MASTAHFECVRPGSIPGQQVKDHAQVAQRRASGILIPKVGRSTRSLGSMLVTAGVSVTVSTPAHKPEERFNSVKVKTDGSVVLR